MKFALLLLPVLFICSCKKSDSSSSSTTTAAVNGSAPFLWSGADFPKDLKISVDFNASETTNITDMGDAWENAYSPAEDFFNFPAGTTPEITTGLSALDSLRDSVMGVYKTTPWPDSLPGSALAITQIFGLRHNIGSGSEYVDILHADILVNYYNHCFQTGDVGTCYDLQTVILHEYGHFLGLKHRTDVATASTIMYPSIGTGFAAAKRAPRSADVTSLTSLYQSSTNPWALMPSRAPADEGQEVKIIIELHADGTCVHRENGVVTHLH
jgi:Matrixin